MKAAILLAPFLVFGCYAMPGAQAPVVALEAKAPPPRPEPVEEPPVVMPKPVAGPGDYEGPPGDPEVVVANDEPEPEVMPTDDVEPLWSDVATAADSLAVKRWQIRLAKESFSKTPKNEQAIKNMEKHHAAVVAEEFCPAATAFRVKAGAREYNKRAAKHCATSAPVATGLSGKQVVLTTECATAFATPCP